MRCKQGDLAIIVKSWAGNEGKIVKCVRLATEKEIDDQNFISSQGPVWVIDRHIKSMFGYQVLLSVDSCMRPIRPSEGQDETLSWKDVPQEELA